MKRAQNANMVVVKFFSLQISEYSIFFQRFFSSLATAEWIDGEQQRGVLGSPSSQVRPSSSSPATAKYQDPLLPQVLKSRIPFFLKSSSSREWSAAAALAPAAGAGRSAGPGSGVRRRVLQECYGVGEGVNSI